MKVTMPMILSFFGLVIITDLSVVPFIINKQLHLLKNIINCILYYYTIIEII
jgi:hypothetical protein